MSKHKGSGSSDPGERLTLRVVGASSLDPHTGQWILTLNSQLFLHQKWVYLGSTKNCSWGSATTVRNLHVWGREARRNSGGKRKVHRRTGELMPGGFSFFGWVLGQEEEVFRPVGGLPLPASQPHFNEVLFTHFHSIKIRPAPGMSYSITISELETVQIFSPAPSYKWENTAGH